METYANQSAYAPVLIASPARVDISSYVAYGVPITLEADVDLLEYLPSPLIPGARRECSGQEPPERFRFFRTHSAAGQPLLAVAQNGTPLCATTELEIAVQVLESRIHQHIAAVTEQAVFVHAGVVRYGDKAIVIPGPSHTGKSTLVSALVGAGMTYYSDEYAVIDFDGYVHAFPRQLRLRPDVLTNTTVTQVFESAGKDTLAPLRIGWVLKVRHNRESAWAPQSLPPGQTVLALLENTVAVRRQSELTVRTLKRALAAAIGFQAERGEAGLAARGILSLMETTGQRSSEI